MIYGTHNSATGGRLVWWLRPLAWVINPTSKCQSKTIDEQLEDGVKLFNLQISYVHGKWRFSHGLAVYEEDVFETLAMMKACAKPKEPIYFQLYLDNCLWAVNSDKAFEELVKQVKEAFCCPYFVMLSAWIEGTKEYPHKSDSKLKWEERYWSATWARINATSLLDKLPLPKYHAKKYNARYKAECNKDYLMLDFYEI
jgi:hypothetical protein